MAVTFSRAVHDLGPSEVDTILSVIEDPNIISFAGGLPAPELFPVEEMKQVAVKVLSDNGPQALQYSATEGFLPLRNKIAKRMEEKFAVKATGSDVLIVSGSQQALDFAGKIFINPGDVILCESPSYMGALQAFDIYGPRYVEVPTDEQGIRTDELAKILASTPNVKMMYVIPDFQNPTGITWTLERRKEFMALINHYEIPVLEDDPYGELRYEGTLLPSLKSMDTKGLIIFLGTFSKIFCPGLRLGWVIASPEILAKFKYVKQAADLHTSSISQRETDAYMDMFDMDAHVANIKSVYKQRRDLALKTMSAEFPPDVAFTHPDGGLFIWVTMPEYIDSQDIFDNGLKNNVAIVPGRIFFANTKKANSFRMNFSGATEEKLVEGIKSLARVIRSFIRK